MKKIALEEHFTRPELSPYAQYGASSRAFAGVRALSGTSARDRRNAARGDGQGGHRHRRALGDDARRAGGARRERRDQARAHRERFPRAPNHQASHALRRLCSFAAARRRGRGRRAFALRRTTRIQGRHGQRPHQRPLSRREELRTVLGAGRSAGRSDLSAPARPLRRASHVRGPSRTLGRDLELDGRDRDARVAPGVRRRVRSPSQGEGHPRPHGRDPALSPVAARQPLARASRRRADRARAIGDRPRKHFRHDDGRLRSRFARFARSRRSAKTT